MYASDGKEGLVNIWKHANCYILTWEECPAGEQYDESMNTRDERHEFPTIEAVLAYLEQAGVPLSQFTP